jgi:hypothetical protein
MRFLQYWQPWSSWCHINSVGHCKPRATLALLLGWTQHYHGTWTLALITQSLTVTQKRGTSSSELCLPNMTEKGESARLVQYWWRRSRCSHISSVGLCEPRATLALWLGWTPRYHGTWTLALITQWLTVTWKGGTSSSELCLPNVTEKGESARFLLYWWWLSRRYRY